MTSYSERRINSKGVENFDLKFGAAEMLVEEPGCIFLFQAAKRPHSMMQAYSLWKAITELSVLGSSGTGQMVTGSL